jgi:hypothetical protein
LSVFAPLLRYFSRYGLITVKLQWTSASNDQEKRVCIDELMVGTFLVSEELIVEVASHKVYYVVSNVGVNLMGENNK